MGGGAQESIRFDQEAEAIRGKYGQKLWFL